MIRFARIKRKCTCLRKARKIALCSDTATGVDAGSVDVLRRTIDLYNIELVTPLTQSTLCFHTAIWLENKPGDDKLACG